MTAENPEFKLVIKVITDEIEHLQKCVEACTDDNFHIRDGLRDKQALLKRILTKVDAKLVERVEILKQIQADFDSYDGTIF